MLQNNSRGRRTRTMANLFQRIFYPEYQCLIFDIVKNYDVHHRHDEWIILESARDTRCSEKSYSVRDKKFFICATCSYNESTLPRVSYRLYMEDNRPASPIPYQEIQLNSKFAEKIYNKMKNKYLDTHNVR